MAVGDYFTHTLANHADCGKKLYYYLNREQAMFSPVLNIGIKLHSLCEAHVKEEDYEIPNTPLMQETFKRMIPELDKLMEQGIDEVELKLDREAEDGFACTGRLDLLMDDGWLVDYKFPNNEWTADKFAFYASTQGYPYMWMAEEYLGVPPKGMKYIVCPTKKGIPVKHFDLPYDEQQIESALNYGRVLLRQVAARRSSGLWPATTNKFTCKWCNWRHVCPETRWKDEDEKPKREKFIVGDAPL